MRAFGPGVGSLDFPVFSAGRFCLDDRVTFASKITITRMAMVPVFAALAVAYAWTVRAGVPDESLRWWALGVYVTAAASDGLDGWIARRFNQRSALGALIDPIADKSLLLTGVVTLSLVDWGQDWHLPLWFAMLVVLREAFILGGIRVLYWKGCEVRIAPSASGKICTVTQMFALGWVMLKVVPFSPVWPCLVAAIFTVWSTMTYARQGVAILRMSR